MRSAIPVAKIGLVVPSLEQHGGVTSVARFVRDTILRSARYDVKLISLPVAARDPLNLSLLQPLTWFRGPVRETREWEGRVLERVGAIAGELEFQRYRPRAVLAEALDDCDLIQVVCGSPAWANAVCGFGKPVAVQCATRARIERHRRDAKPRGPAGWWRWAMTIITDRMDDKALRRVDAIQVENSWMLDYAQQVNRHRSVDIRYAPPGVDAQQFSPADRRSPKERRGILCVGRLDDPRKNVEMLLDAYSRLPEAVRVSNKLRLAGSGSPTKSLWSRAQALGLAASVEFIDCPSRDELVKIYQSAAVFALSSDEEGLGVVILEAMACGVPVVATRCGGPEGIIADGVDGFLVPRNDAGAMASRLQKLLESPALNDAMGQRARATIETRYAEAVAGQTFLDVWERLLCKPARQLSVD